MVLECSLWFVYKTDEPHKQPYKPRPQTRIMEPQTLNPKLILNLSTSDKIWGDSDSFLH